MSMVHFDLMSPPSSEKQVEIHVAILSNVATVVKDAPPFEPIGAVLFVLQHAVVPGARRL